LTIDDFHSSIFYTGLSPGDYWLRLKAVSDKIREVLFGPEKITGYQFKVGDNTFHHVALPTSAGA
jgi:hypothetical protein